MAFTHSLTERITVSAATIEKITTKTAQSRISLEETIANSAVDYQIFVSIDISALVSLYLVSTRNVTLETNDGGAPNDTISLVANVPYIWHSTSYHPKLFTVDVADVFITNSSGASATLQLEALVDPTP